MCIRDSHNSFEFADWGTTLTNHPKCYAGEPLTEPALHKNRCPPYRHEGRCPRTATSSATVDANRLLNGSARIKTPPSTLDWHWCRLTSFHTAPGQTARHPLASGRVRGERWVVLTDNLSLIHIFQHCTIKPLIEQIRIELNKYERSGICF